MRAGGRAPVAGGGMAGGVPADRENGQQGGAVRPGAETIRGAAADLVTEADRVAAAVRVVPLGAGLSGGPVGGVGTYVRGRRILGVRVAARVVEVHVTGRYGYPVTEIAGAVRAAVAGVTSGQRIDVVIEDLA